MNIRRREDAPKLRLRIVGVYVNCMRRQKLLVIIGCIEVAMMTVAITGCNSTKSTSNEKTFTSESIVYSLSEAETAVINVTADDDIERQETENLVETNKTEPIAEATYAQVSYHSCSEHENNGTHVITNPEYIDELIKEVTTYYRKLNDEMDGDVITVDDMTTGWSGYTISFGNENDSFIALSATDNGVCKWSGDNYFEEEGLRFQTDTAIYKWMKKLYKKAGKQNDNPKGHKLVYLNGKLYQDTGAKSDIVAHNENADGVLGANVGEEEYPYEHGKTNFGVGYKYQFVGENTLDVCITDKSGTEKTWQRFAIVEN